MVKAKGSRDPRTPCSHTKDTSPTRFKALEGITHPSKASGATSTGCARVHPPDSFLQTQTNQNCPWALILKPLKEYSTPSQARGLLSGINSRHTQPRAIIACQLLNCPRLGYAFHLVRALVTSSKRLTPAPCRERLLPRPTLATKARERPIPLAYFRLAQGTRGALWQDREPWGPSPWHPLPLMGRT
jgi:hypothetical protein